MKKHIVIIILYIFFGNTSWACDQHSNQKASYSQKVQQELAYIFNQTNPCSINFNHLSCEENSWADIDNCAIDTDLEPKELLSNKAINIQKCATSKLIEARANWETLDDDTQWFFEEAIRRPERDILEKTQQTEHFMIHYSMREKHRPLGKKSSNQEVKLWVERLKYYLEVSYYKFIGERNYRQPVPDGQRGGGTDLNDVYVMDLGMGVTGLTYSDGPASEGSNKAVTYMFISNSLQKVDEYGGNPMKATAAHEFFHMIQNSYYGSSLASMPNNAVTVGKSTSLREGTAVWAESVMFKHPHREVENRSYYAYLPISSSIFSAPYKHLLINEEADFSIYAYSTGFFWKYLAEQHGDDVIRQIWEGNATPLSRNEPASEKELQVLNKVFAAQGGFSNIFANFSIAATLLTNNDIYDHYQKKYPQYTFKNGRSYARYLPRNEPVKILQKPANHRNPVWHSPNNEEKVFWNLKSFGGAAFHNIKKGAACNYNIKVQPARATYNLEPTDLYAVLLKQNTNNGNIDIKTASYNSGDNYTLINDNNHEYNKLTLIVYRMTDPAKAESVRNSTLRYEITFDPISNCDEALAK